MHDPATTSQPSPVENRPEHPLVWFSFSVSLSLFHPCRFASFSRRQPVTRSDATHGHGPRRHGHCSVWQCLTASVRCLTTHELVSHAHSWQPHTSSLSFSSLGSLFSLWPFLSFSSFFSLSFSFSLLFSDSNLSFLLIKKKKKKIFFYAFTYFTVHTKYYYTMSHMLVTLIYFRLLVIFIF